MLDINPRLRNHLKFKRTPKKKKRTPKMRCVQSSMPNPSEKNGGAMCRRRAAHCTDFSNHRCPIHRKKYGGAMCRRRAAHCTDFSNHRCPIHRKKSGGAISRRRAAHCTDFSNHRCPIIDTRSSMPDPLEKICRCNVPPPGGTLHRLFHSSEFPINRNSRERHCIPNRSE